VKDAVKWCYRIEADPRAPQVAELALAADDLHKHGEPDGVRPLTSAMQ
jgi:hypothetical protein